MGASEEFLFALDTTEPVRINAEECYLRGWCIPKAAGDLTLQVLVNGVSFEVYSGLPRPDVVRYYGNPEAANSGFIARFSVPAHRTSRVKLIARSSHGESLLATKTVLPLSDARSQSRYCDWVVHREPALFWPKGEISERLSPLPYRPLISVVLPIYETHPYLLKRSVESVLNQHYAFWELCVITKSGVDPGISSYLKEVAAGDSRVQIALTQISGELSAFNIGFERAKGEFVVPLDHGDELHPFALLELVRALNRNDDTQIIYSDQDQLDSYGGRERPFFKPAFDLDMFLASNYLGRLVALRRMAISSVGGFRERAESAQEWDLLLRVIEAFGPSCVRHIAKLLYHSRMRDDVLGAVTKLEPSPLTMLKVLKDHLRRTGKKATVEPGLYDGTVRLKWPLPQEIHTAVFIRMEDGAFQHAALESNVDSQYTTIYEVAGCAVHKAGGRASSEGGPHRIQSLSELSEQVLIFINRPLEAINHSFFKELAAQAMRAHCGLVTGVSVSPDGRVLHAGFVCTPPGASIDSDVGVARSDRTPPLSSCRAVDGISDYFFATRREHMAAVGGLSSVSTSHMPQLVRKLAKHAKASQLKILFTPYAVATFEGVGPTLPWEPLEAPDESSLKLNPNLVTFQGSDEMVALS